MESQILTFPGAGEEIQRVQLVRFDSWEDLNFWQPEPSDNAFACFRQIYRQYLIPAAPWVFGSLVMFRLPEGLQVPEALMDRWKGRVEDPMSVAALSLRRGVLVLGRKPLFRDEAVKQLWQTLSREGCLSIVKGKLPMVTSIIPVANRSGYLTESEPDAQLKVNASFFIMDPFDCATGFDHISIPFGLLVKNGVVENPPLYAREALLVRQDGSVEIEMPRLQQMKLRIGDRVYLHGENARIFSRPRHFRSPLGRRALVIIGRTVAAVYEGSAPIPCSGFVLCPEGECLARPGDTVTYEGMEDVVFGIQVGNSILRNGVKTEKFLSRFFNIRGLQRIAYPPCLYPLDFQNARAARIALGADKSGKPMLLWAEGAAKLGHVPGQDSQGASLSDMAGICARVGMVNAVNLDGGGSAQLLMKNKRSLRISDRNADFTESQRPVPLGLIVK